MLGAANRDRPFRSDSMAIPSDIDRPFEDQLVDPTGLCRLAPRAFKHLLKKCAVRR